MRALILVAGAALAVAACGSNTDTHQPGTLYHLPDGRTAYQADNGIWYYLIANQMIANINAQSGASLGLSGGYANSAFQRAAAPSFDEVQEAATEQVPVIEEEETTPSATTEEETTSSPTADEGEESSSTTTSEEE